MKALFTLKSARKMGLLVSVFVVTAPLIYPEVVLPQVVLASESQARENQPLVFEIKNPSLIQKSINPNSLSFDEVVQNDPLATAPRNLYNFTAKHGLYQPLWQLWLNQNPPLAGRV